MTDHIHWKKGVYASGLVFLICFPFTDWSMALILGAISGIFLLFSEEQLGRRFFHSKSDGNSAGFSNRYFTLFSYLNVFSYPSIVRITLLIAAIISPLVLGRYTIEVVTLGLIYVTLAIGLNYIVGLSGLLALGYIAFYAVGAYTYALLNVNFDVNFFLCLPLGFTTGAIAGALVGLPVLRLRGDYLAIVTLGFGEITRLVLNNWDELTRGPNGVMGIARPDLFGIKVGTPVGYYLLALLLAVITMLVQKKLIHSKTGRAWEAIREDELAAAHVGVPVVKMKMLAMTLGGAWAGVAGALFAARMTHVSPESFTFMESILVLCMVVLGGMGSVWGVAVGAIVLIVAPEMLRGIAEYRMLVFGLVMVLMMQYRPAGIIPGKRMKVNMDKA